MFFPWGPRLLLRLFYTIAGCFVVVAICSLTPVARAWLPAQWAAWAAGIGALIGGAYGYFIITAIMIPHAVGQVYSWIRPRAVTTWRTLAQTGGFAAETFSSSDIGLFVLTRVPAAEACRTGATGAAAYLWIRLLEHRAGIRVPAAAETPWPLVRSLLGAMPRWWPAVLLPFRLDRARLRATIAVARLGTDRDHHIEIAETFHSRTTITEVALLLARDPHPREVEGWLLGWECAVTNQHLGRREPVRAARDMWRDRPGIPGWLLPLAGFPPGAPIPPDTTRSSLEVLAALRGYQVPRNPLDLLDDPCHT